jgi:hypothetical protein
VISVFFLLMAILVFCLKTHPNLRVYELGSVGSINSTVPILHEEQKMNERPRTFYKYQTEAIGIDKGNSRPHPIFMVIETICNVSCLQTHKNTVFILDMVYSRDFYSIYMLPIQNQLL